MHFCCICKPKKTLKFECHCSDVWNCPHLGLVLSALYVAWNTGRQISWFLRLNAKTNVVFHAKQNAFQDIMHTTFSIFHNDPLFLLIPPYSGRQFPRSTPCNVKSLQKHLVDSWWKMWNSIPWSYFLNILTTWKHCQRHYWSKVWMSASKFWPKFIFKI